MRKPVDFNFKLKEKSKVYVYCKNKCSWMLYASTVSGEFFSRGVKTNIYIYIYIYIYINPNNNLSYLYYSPQQQKQPSLSVNIFGISNFLKENKEKLLIFYKSIYKNIYFKYELI